MTPTSIEELKKAKLTTIRELPSFPDGTPLVVELKKPSLIDMTIRGRILNPLLTSAISIIPTEDKEKAEGEKATPALNAEDFKSTAELFITICEECMVKPTYAEVKEYAGGLTDEQILAIYNYTQEGMDKLQSFR